MSQKVSYRMALKSDIPKLARLDDLLIQSQKKYSWFYDLKKDYRKKILSFVKKMVVSKNAGVFVAETKKTIIGYCIIEIRKPLSIIKCKKEAVLVDIFIMKSYRSKGIGSKLFSMAEEFAKKKKAGLFSLYVVEGNPAEKLYKRKGFELFKKLYVKRLV